MKTWAELTPAEKERRRNHPAAKATMLLIRFLWPVISQPLIAWVFFIDLRQSGLRGALTNVWDNERDGFVLFFTGREPWWWSE